MRTEIERRVRKALRSIDGVLESPGMFMHDDAYWVNGKEIAHFHEDDLELCLTRSVFSAHRDRLRADPRIERRAPSSDWVGVRCTSPRDVAFVAELAALAAQAHRPAYRRSAEAATHRGRPGTKAEVPLACLTHPPSVSWI